MFFLVDSAACAKTSLASKWIFQGTVTISNSHSKIAMAITQSIKLPAETCSHCRMAKTNSNNMPATAPKPAKV
ncbi:MAG: hypothetical protein AVDCRST_MAG96-4178 [uncultured Segetibacter sp.]|uniref:Uncharacterized protein n=1 Tax=uncultured Segetibacter sp. TaxID=481133 RepID=A0A6J4U473_9BACT|nr:MAG: hypothetical protein AVDCRST_MAG96-4178 [uncultured Segetibacter sp.]